VYLWPQSKPSPKLEPESSSKPEPLPKPEPESKDRCAVCGSTETRALRVLKGGVKVFLWLRHSNALD
jgi:hypothetical protein